MCRPESQYVADALYLFIFYFYYVPPKSGRVTQIHPATMEGNSRIYVLMCGNVCLMSFDRRVGGLREQSGVASRREAKKRKKYERQQDRPNVNSEIIPLSNLL